MREGEGEIPCVIALEEAGMPLTFSDDELLRRRGKAPLADDLRGLNKGERVGRGCVKRSDI